MADDVGAWAGRQHPVQSPRPSRLDAAHPCAGRPDLTPKPPPQRTPAPQLARRAARRSSLSGGALSPELAHGSLPGGRPPRETRGEAGRPRPGGPAGHQHATAVGTPPAATDRMEGLRTAVDPPREPRAPPRRIILVRETPRARPPQGPGRPSDQRDSRPPGQVAPPGPTSPPPKGLARPAARRAAGSRDGFLDGEKPHKPARGRSDPPRRETFLTFSCRTTQSGQESPDTCAAAESRVRDARRGSAYWSV